MTGRALQPVFLVPGGNVTSYYRLQQGYFQRTVVRTKILAAIRFCQVAVK